MEENKKYELVGILNYFDLIPCTVYPIFRDSEGIYYGAFCEEDSPYISTFMPFPSKERIKDIKRFTKTHNIFEILPGKEFYQVGDLALCALQTSKKNVYVGTIDKYVEYAKSLLWCMDNGLNAQRKEIVEAFTDELQDDIEFCEMKLKNLESNQK